MTVAMVDAIRDAGARRLVASCGDTYAAEIRVSLNDIASRYLEDMVRAAGACARLSRRTVIDEEFMRFGSRAAGGDPRAPLTERTFAMSRSACRRLLRMRTVPPVERFTRDATLFAHISTERYLAEKIKRSNMCEDDKDREGETPEYLHSMRKSLEPEFGQASTYTCHVIKSVVCLLAAFLRTCPCKRTINIGAVSLFIDTLAHPLDTWARERMEAPPREIPGKRLLVLRKAVCSLVNLIEIDRRTTAEGIDAICKIVEAIADTGERREGPAFRSL